MKNVPLAATLVVSLFASTTSFGSDSKDVTPSEKSINQPAKIKEYSCAPVKTTCGKAMWACGESSAEMLDCAVEAEHVACG